MNIKINKMSGRIHPLMAAAAVSVMLVSLIGVAAITGIIPTSKADHAVATPVQPTQTALMAPGTVQTQPNQLAQAAPLQPAPVHHTPTHHHQSTNYSQANGNNGQYGNNPQPNRVYSQQAAADVCANCGRVESVQAIQSAAKPSGVGIGVGAVIGGLLGNQVGGGNGRTLATVAGAVGGGYAGNEVEKRTHTATSYQVHVRMDDGESRTFPQQGAEGWRVGDRVRVVNGELTSRG